jgi:transposase
MVTEKMNTKNMAAHLKQISRRMKHNFVVIIVDGASSHTTKKLEIPRNISLVKLPPYSPELNPTEQIWRMLRGDYFGNRVFHKLDDAICQARHALRDMARNKYFVTQLTYWPWISKALFKIRKYSN